MSEMSRLQGRTVLVTGASSGLGEHFARVLAKAGARVVLGARRSDRTAVLRSELEAAGGQALAVPLDVTDERSISAAFDAAERQFGTVETIVANAGISKSGRSTEVSSADLRALVDTNVIGAYLTAREGAKRLIATGSRESERGRIVLIGSITADMTGGGDAAYAASKAALVHLGRQFAREWVRQGINVNTIQPGYMQTELTGRWFSSEGGKAQIATWHRRRLLPVDALDAMLIYLGGDESRFVTGGSFTIDDGHSL